MERRGTRERSQPQEASRPKDLPSYPPPWEAGTRIRPQMERRGTRERSQPQEASRPKDLSLSGHQDSESLLPERGAAEALTAGRRHMTPRARGATSLLDPTGGAPQAFRSLAQRSVGLPGLWHTESTPRGAGAWRSGGRGYQVCGTPGVDPSGAWRSGGRGEPWRSR